MATLSARSRRSPLDARAIGSVHDVNREHVRVGSARRGSHRCSRAASVFPVLGALALVAGTAWADEIVLRPSGSHFSSHKGANEILVALVNKSALQGLQFHLDYDPAIARPVAVAGLGRLADSRGLQYRIERGTIRALVCDVTAARTSIEPGDDPIVSVAFALADSVPSDALRVSVGGGLAVTDLLATRRVWGDPIAIPIARSATPVEEPVGRGAGAAGLARGVDPSAALTRFALHAAGPNPFSSGTMLFVDVPRPARVMVAVYDAGGRLVRVLTDRFMEAGRHAAHWDGAAVDGSRAGAGLFFVRMTAEGFVCNRKVIALQ